MTDKKVAAQEEAVGAVAEAEKIIHILTRDEILESEDLATETVSVPEWGGSVIVRALTGTERDAYEAEGPGAMVAAGNSAFSASTLSITFGWVRPTSRAISRTVPQDK